MINLIFSLLYILTLFLTTILVVWRMRRSFWLYHYTKDKFIHDPKFRTLYSVSHHGGFLKEERILKNPALWATNKMQGHSIVILIGYALVVIGIYAIFYKFLLPDKDNINYEFYFYLFRKFFIYLLFSFWLCTIVYGLLCFLYVYVFEKVGNEIGVWKKRGKYLPLLIYEYNELSDSDKNASYWIGIVCIMLYIAFSIIFLLLFIFYYDYYIEITK